MEFGKRVLGSFCSRSTLGSLRRLNCPSLPASFKGELLASGALGSFAAPALELELELEELDSGSSPG